MCECACVMYGIVLENCMIASFHLGSQT